MKTTAQIIRNLKNATISGNVDIALQGITMDSRAVREGFLFFAVRGTTVDGHTFIEQAIEKGAATIVCEKLPAMHNQKTAFVVVANTSEAMGIIAAEYFGNPSSKLKLTGITGTNGKTTIATLLYNVFSLMGYKTGLLSTVENKIGDISIASTHTTPDQISLNSLLARMVYEGCTHCFMEVSSHAVVQHRITGLHFAGGVFTNLTHDHLDYHKDFKSYRDAKKAFFDSLESSAFSISNADDTNGSVMLQNTASEKYYYSLRKPAEFKGLVIENSINGLQMRIAGQDIHFQLKGRFNAYNLLAIYATAVKLGLYSIDVLATMSQLTHVDGRFHSVENKKGVHAIVDYAHTPDALENVLKTIDELRSGNETLIVVVGAGGNRDKTKRPLMAAICARFANTLILTSDNPRNEEPSEILQDMKQGLDAFSLSNTLIIEDRSQAIKTACMMVSSGDIILVAGKGHETYQEVKGEKFEFDDKQKLSEYLNI